jgi:LemA protein
MSGLVAVVLAVAILMVAILRERNRLVASRARVRAAWAQVDAQLARRHALVPRLVAGVVAEREHERQVLAGVHRALAATGRDGSTAGPTAAVTVGPVETGLTAALLALEQAHPRLRSADTTLRLQEDLLSTENRVAAARQHYNDTALLHTTAVQTVPTNLVARLFGIGPAPYLDLRLLSD